MEVYGAVTMAIMEHAEKQRKLVAAGLLVDPARLNCRPCIRVRASGVQKHLLLQRNLH
jgi:hypothetical protein